MAILGERSGLPCMVLILLCATLLLSGYGIDALPYDYTATVECLDIPHKPQYNGGIIKNPELNNGSLGWFKFGNPEIDHRTDVHGNSFIVARNRQRSYDSVSHKVFLERDNLYTLSAWIQVSGGSNIPVRAVFKTRNGFQHAGAVIAKPNCWSMLKGGLTVDTTGIVELYFEADNTSVEIWVDSISLQPFTHEVWNSHQEESIEKWCKTQVKLHIVDKNNNSIPNVNVTVELARASFPFGCAINRNFKNLPTGDVVDKLLKEWAPAEAVNGTTDENGVFEATLVYGEYRVVIYTVPTVYQSFEVVDSGEESVTVEVMI